MRHLISTWNFSEQNRRRLSAQKKQLPSPATDSATHLCWISDWRSLVALLSVWQLARLNVDDSGSGNLSSGPVRCLETFWTSKKFSHSASSAAADSKNGILYSTSGSETMDWLESETTGLSPPASDSGMIGLSVPDWESESGSSAEERELSDLPPFICWGCSQWGKTEAGPEYFNSTVSHVPLWSGEEHSWYWPAMHEMQKQESCLDAKTPGPKICQWWIFLDPGTVDSMLEFTLFLISGRRKNFRTLCWHPPLSGMVKVLRQWSYMTPAFVTVTLPHAQNHQASHCHFSHDGIQRTPFRLRLLGQERLCATRKEMAA